MGKIPKKYRVFFGTHTLDVSDVSDVTDVSNVSNVSDVSDVPDFSDVADVIVIGIVRSQGSLFVCQKSKVGESVSQ